MSLLENIHNGESGKKSFNEMKSQYFSYFALRHLSTMRILRGGGILGKENIEWRNIAEHCLVEAVGADILAEYTGADRDSVVVAALLHDWYKRNEIEAMKQEGVSLGYKKADQKDRLILKTYGIDDAIISLTHSNIIQSIDPLYLEQRTLNEKIIHFIDFATSGTHFVQLKERRQSLEKKKQNIDFSNSFKNQYEGNSLYDVQYMIGAQEQEEFEKLIGVESGSLIIFLKKKMIERIHAEAMTSKD